MFASNVKVLSIDYRKLEDIPYPFCEEEPLLEANYSSAWINNSHWIAIFFNSKSEIFA